MSDRTVLLAGATGLVGRHVLHRLAEDPTVGRIRVVARRPLPDGLRPPDPHGRIEEVIVDFEALDAHAERLAADQVICALGTTIRKAGSQEAFRRVDRDYPFALARIGLGLGARHFLLVSALGADPKAWTFYNRTKGEVEAAIRALPYRSVTIARPSLLLGERDEFRLGERVAERLAFLAPPPYRAIHADVVAEALVAAAREDRPGVHVLESAAMRRAAS